ncbi:TetR/AcrR family transcriptional regulator [Streptomyces spirodelae]|uniref:TetR/AcrR family transcriptional regulator n=1 Tax=Streptomyces spirodelae TaxID=2812904 RepID=A0ABS3WU49_9ACTN|nr:TetR/AcrR family transcriptional regulator [Streptomyces spirodelae]MBO8186381.1 TetR/AcrR family transcriptional regulator [Streptomyces spirodelae]
MARTIGEPRNARSRKTVAALLQAARELIEEQGFESLTMAAAAERAGVSRRGAYLHFSTRGELLTALYRSLGEVEQLAASLQKVWDAPDALATLREWAEHIARSHPRILAVLHAVERARHTDPDAAELWETTLTNWRRGSRRVIERLQAEHRLAPPWTVDTATDMLWALTSLDILDRLMTRRRWSRKGFAQHLTALLEATFTTPGARDEG